MNVKGPGRLSFPASREASDYAGHSWNRRPSRLGLLQRLFPCDGPRFGSRAGLLAILDFPDRWLCARVWRGRSLTLKALVALARCDPAYRISDTDKVARRC